MREVEGDGRRERGAARPANSAVKPAFDGRNATNGDDCDADVECVAQEEAICRAMAVSEKTTRESFEANTLGVRGWVTHRLSR